MQYKTFPPPPHLNGLVFSYWNLESSDCEVMPSRYFLMADHCPEMIFQYNKGFRNYPAQSARLRFQHTIHSDFDVADSLGFFGVRLLPQAVNALLGIPATEVVNEVLDVDLLFKKEGRMLVERVMESETIAERIALLSGFLTEKISAHNIDPLHRFVDHIQQLNGQVDMADCQQASGLSVKQFERRFKAISGFAPKFFARMARFQAVKDKQTLMQYRTMTKLAYAGNYYDQAHFNREFREFSGVQPLAYFRKVSPGLTAADAGEPLTEGGFKGYLPCGWFTP